MRRRQIGREVGEGEKKKGPERSRMARDGEKKIEKHERSGHREEDERDEERDEET